MSDDKAARPKPPPTCNPDTDEECPDIITGGLAGLWARFLRLFRRPEPEPRYIRPRHTPARPRNRPPAT